MQRTFLVKIRFWVEDLGGRYYKDHVGGSRIENIRYITL